MGKQYASVLDFVKDRYPEDSEFADSLEQQIEDRRLVRLLAKMRNFKNLNQKDIADAMDCKQSRVSKLENGYDRDVKVGDILDYAKAMNCEIQFVFSDRPLNAIDRIKRHALAIQRELSELTAIVKGDAVIASGVSKLIAELLYNIGRFAQDAMKKLPKPPKGEPQIRLSVESEEMSEIMES